MKLIVPAYSTAFMDAVLNAAAHGFAAKLAMIFNRTPGPAM